MISHKYKCIFIHIPRCAGTSIELAINGKPNNGSNFSFKHLTASYAKILYKDYWDDYFKFSIVRNPWSRMVSMCKCEDFYGCILHKNKLNIDQYVKKFPKVEIDHRTDCNINHHDTIYDNSVFKNLLLDDLDFVGKFENLEENFIFLKKTLGLEVNKFPLFERTQSGPRIRNNHYSTYYDDNTRERVAQLYAQDIKDFGYEFGE